MVAHNSITPRPALVHRGLAAGITRQHPVKRLLPALLLLTALLSQVFASSGNATVAWVTALTFASFILIVNGPAWALVPILINEMTLYSYVNPTFGVGQRFVVVLLAIILAASAISKGRLFSDIRMRRVLLPSIGFVVFVTVMNMQHSGDAYVFQYLRYQLLQVFMLILAACLIRHAHDIKQITIIAVVVTAAVSLIVIWQHYAPSTALYGIRQGTQQGRAVGLVNSPVSLANQLIFVLPPMLGVLIALRFRWQRNHLLLLGCTLLTAVALNYTYTRSAVFAFVPAIIVMALLFGGRRRMLMLGMVIIGVILFFALENTGLIGHRYYRNAEDDRSASSHEVLKDISLAIALDHPVSGIGHERFLEVSLDYAEVADGQALGAVAVGEHQPHNDFLNVWLSWGIFALIPYIGIFVGAFRNFAICARNSDPFTRGLAIGCAGGLVTYAVNSYYHNSMDSSSFLWMYAGLSVALARLATTRTIPFR